MIDSGRLRGPCLSLALTLTVAVCCVLSPLNAQVGASGSGLVLETTNASGIFDQGSHEVPANGAFSVRVSITSALLNGQSPLIGAELRVADTAPIGNFLGLNLPGLDLGGGGVLAFDGFASGVTLTTASTGIVLPAVLSRLGDARFGYSLHLQAAVPTGMAMPLAILSNPIRLDPPETWMPSRRLGTGLNTDAIFGESIMGADLDQDGIEDLIVGASKQHLPPSYFAGIVRVELSATAQTIDLQAPTPTGFAEFGRDTAVGDLNSDGILDIAVGARAENLGVQGAAGAAYIFEGPAFTTVTRLTSPNPLSMARFGHSIEIVDWNDDGAPDLVVGEPRATVQLLAEAGTVHIFLGPSFTTSVTLSAPVPQALSRYGYALAVGDCNNDSREDLVVGAPFEDMNIAVDDDTGRIYAYLSPAAMPTVTLSQPMDLRALLGAALEVVDLNGDGNADIIAGAEFADVSPAPGTLINGAGQVRIWSGPSLGTPQVLNAAAPQTLGGFGSDVAVGDANNDGFLDIIVGAMWQQRFGLNRAGGGWLLYGPSFTHQNELALTPFAAETDGWAGRRVALIDLNGTGRALPILAAPYSSPDGRTLAGALHIYN